MRKIVSGGLACLLVAAAMIVTVEPADAAAHTAFNPVADSYVQSHNPDTNYGLRTTVRTDGSPERNTYLKFDVQGEGTVSSAVLRVYAESRNNTGFEIRTVTDTSWDESNAHLQQRPGARSGDRHLGSRRSRYLCPTSTCLRP